MGKRRKLASGLDWRILARIMFRGSISELHKDTGWDGGLSWGTTQEEIESAAHNFRRIDASGGVARVHLQLRLLDNGLVVVGGMVGDDDHGVELGEVVERGVGHVKGVVAALAHGGKVG